MSEPWSWAKFFDFSPVVWSKALKMGLILAVVALLGLTIYKAYFVPTQKQTQTNTITAQPGSTVNIGQSQSSAKARPWWLPRLFTELYAFAESDSRTGIGSKVGARWEF
jgi:hypothetical protein